MTATHAEAFTASNPPVFAQRPALHCARRVLVDHHRAVAGYQGVPRARTLAPVGMPVGIGLGEPEPEGEAAQLIKPTFVRCNCHELAEGELDWLDPETTVLEIIELAEPGTEASAFDLE